MAPAIAFDSDGRVRVADAAGTCTLLDGTGRVLEIVRHGVPLRGAALFTFDPNLVFLVIDSLFGGHGRYNTRVEGRDFTTTEQRIIRRLLNMTLESYAGAWEQVYPIEFEYIRSEMHTKFASITSGNEIVVVSSFNIELGASGGKLNVCLPYSMIEPVRDLLTRPLQEANAGAIDQRWTSQLSRQVRSADVELVAGGDREVLPVEPHLHVDVFAAVTR